MLKQDIPIRKAFCTEDKMDKKKRIYEYVSHESYKPLTVQEMCIALDVPKPDRAFFAAYVNELISEGKLVQSKKGLIKRAETPSDVIYGTLHALKSGNAYVTPIETDCGLNEDIFVAKKDVERAFDGDVVAVKLYPMKKSAEGKSREGAVKKIIRHGADECIGTVKEKGGRLVFVPDAMHYADAVMSENGAVCADGQKVLAKILRYPSDGQMKVCVTEVFGDKHEVSALTECIVRENKIPQMFSDEAMKQAGATAAEVTDAEILGRADFRGDRVITIDGEDARDLDDAVCVKKHDDGSYTLYVHIADVSHYVREGSAIDRDAYERATSVYLPDRVIPMLPRELSNGICSLNEGVDRLTMSVSIELDADGGVRRSKIEKGVICSLHRMTYTAVTAMLEGDETLCERYSDIAEDICNMRDLAMRLKHRRNMRGAIDFSFPEPKIILDDSGAVAGVETYTTGAANEIIEQFMLLANETVARYACDNDLPFVFRVHEPPDGEKLSRLEKCLNVFSVPSNFSETEKIEPRDIQKIVNSIKGTPMEGAISVLCLRSMMKARYAPENLGHFGLASEYYCHFTSPIRRYPDLAIHRILSESITKKLAPERKNRLEVFVKNASALSSDAEVRAVEAERAADKMCACLYMKNFIGEEFDAVVSGVTDFGIFVEVYGCIEGLVPMTGLCDDYYIYEDELMQLRGERTGRRFRLGDKVRVRLVSSSARLRIIDFEIADMVGNKKQKPKQAKKSPDAKSKKKAYAKKRFKSFVKKKGRKKR